MTVVLFPVFYVFFFRINSCPNNCSEHGKCTTSVSVPSRVYCECDKYWKGEACDIPYCKANCGSPDHGYCDLTGEKLCVCNDSWQGKILLSEMKLIFKITIFNASYLVCILASLKNKCKLKNNFWSKFLCGPRWVYFNAIKGSQL